MSVPDAPAEAPYAIPPIPELYWDGIQFYLPSKGDGGTDGYSVMYLADGGYWAYQGWTEAPSEDCSVVPVVAALAGTTTPTDDRRLLEAMVTRIHRLLDRCDELTDAWPGERQAITVTEIRALLASAPTTEETEPNG